MIPDLAAVEAEVLGSCLLSAPVVDRLAIDCELEPSDFTHPPYRAAWVAIRDLHAKNGAVTQATLASALGDDGPQIVAELANSIGQVSGIVPNGRLIKRNTLRRTWQQAGFNLIEAAERDDEELVAQAEQTLATPTISEDTVNASGVAEATNAFIADTGSVGIPTGFLALDNRIGGGLRPGDSTALGAWTSMGKSALVDQILTNATLAGGARCHAYINEMSIVDRGLRMIARQSTIPYSDLVVRRLDAQQREIASRVAKKIPFGLTDCAQWSAPQIARHIRANKWDLCAVDLLHNMDYLTTSDLDRIVGTLAAAARTANSHLIIVCQFNEERAKTERLPRPVSRDLRGSGMIKNACANVLLLHRQQEQKGDAWFTTEEALLIIDKARHGQRGMIDLTFLPESMSFDTTGPRAVEEAA